MTWTRERVPCGPASFCWVHARSEITMLGRLGGLADLTPIRPVGGHVCCSINASSEDAGGERGLVGGAGTCGGVGAGSGRRWWVRRSSRNPARRRPSPAADPSGNRVTRWRYDVERVNRLLRSGLTFYIEPGGGRGPPEPTDGGSWSPRGGGGRGSADAACEGERARPAKGVLVMVLEDGRRRTAACSIPITGSDRGRRLSIARGLSECAMALGLGAGVYRRRR